MIDLHCHVLPGLDDGPPTMKDSLALAAAAAAGGTRTIVATPHVSWDWPANDGETIRAAVGAVNAALRTAGIAVEVLAGGEVALSRAADLTPTQLEALRIGGGAWLLVECPLTQDAAGLERGVASLAGQGHRILLAHPERCPAFQRDPGRLAALVADGALTSITATAFGGRFGRTVRRFAFELLARGLVHSVASDAHDAVRRPPALAAALQAAGLGEQAEHLANSVPQAILRDEPIPEPAPRPGRFGRRGRLRR